MGKCTDPRMKLRTRYTMETGGITQRKKRPGTRRRGTELARDHRPVAAQEHLPLFPQVRVLELENELQKERQKLGVRRKKHYELAGVAEGWEEGGPL